MIDFTEIPSGNRGGAFQDRFEEFASMFLLSVGFKILEGPSRGADGGKDLIVTEAIGGNDGSGTIKWLVSCKHHAYTNQSVSTTHEKNIMDRVMQHECDGFLAFYSTSLTSGLSSALSGLTSRIKITIYDRSRIERQILDSKDRDIILASFFPKSRERLNLEESIARTKSSTSEETEFNRLLEVTLTSTILLEIDKIRDEFDLSNWQNAENQLEKLHRFSKYANDKIRESVWEFLEYISSMTRANMPKNVALAMFSIFTSFYPTYEDIETQSKSASDSIQIAYNMAYDCLIYLKGYWAAIYGLLILKFVYREAKRMGAQEIKSNVINQYDRLFQSINRPERPDLDTAYKLLNYFKDDIDVDDLSIPPLPDELLHVIT